MSRKRLDDYLNGKTLEEFLSQASEPEVFDFCQCISIEKTGAENAIIKAQSNPDHAYSAEENDAFIARQRRRLGFIKACEVNAVRALSKFKNEQKRKNRQDNFTRQKLKLLKQAIRTVCSKEKNSEILELYGQLVEANLLPSIEAQS